MKEKHLYRFGEFSLSVEDHALRRGDINIPMTPKMFDLLLVLVQHPGRVLGKEFLLEAVWPDSFVEEGNITFNIRQLRKALGDDKQSPLYIETVPRRGYRFVAKVESETISEPDESGMSEEKAEPANGRSRRSLVMVGVLAALLIGGVYLGVWFVRNKTATAVPILDTPFTSEKLSTSGLVSGAALSPDGKTVVYTSRSANKQGVWLRQLDTGNNVPFLPPTDDYYYLFAFAPDGASIYFTRAKQDVETQVDVYRISILGGIPEKIASKTQGWLSVSQDGSTVSFVRCPRTEEEYCSLWIADSRGGNERRLVTRDGPIRIAENQISPDGKRIAFAAGQSRNSANEFQIFEVDIATGVERELTPERFFNVKAIAWLPDASGLLFTASRIQNKYYQIWRLTAATGEVEPLTKDSETYSVLSLDREGRQLVSTQVTQNFRLYRFDLDDPSRRQFLADAARASVAPDGRVYFASVLSGNDEIWSINPDGSDQRQLTNHPAGDGSPIVSPDNRTVFFTSNRSGEAHIWRMNIDGSSQTQVTRKEGGGPIFMSPDGNLLYYKHSLHANLWSVSLQTGEERRVIEEAKPLFAISPDASIVGFEDRVGDRFTLTLLSLADGKVVANLELAKEKPRLAEFSFTPDGKSIVYTMADVDYDNNIVYIQSIDGGAPRKLGSLGIEPISEVSGLGILPDGKSATVVLGDWRHDAVLLTGLR